VPNSRRSRSRVGHTSKKSWCACSTRSAWLAAAGAARGASRRWGPGGAGCEGAAQRERAARAGAGRRRAAPAASPLALTSPFRGRAAASARSARWPRPRGSWRAADWAAAGGRAASPARGAAAPAVAVAAATGRVAAPHGAAPSAWPRPPRCFRRPTGPLRAAARPQNSWSRAVKRVDRNLGVERRPLASGRRSDMHSCMQNP
jgi:hypothetical protein